VVELTATPTITANAQYAAGKIVGGLMTFPIQSGSGRLSGIHIICRSAQTMGLKIYLFDANPSHTTWTDNTTPAINAADVTAVRAAFLFTAPDKHLGAANTVWNKEGIGCVFSASNLYAIAVTLGWPTFASTSDLTFTFTTQPDTATVTQIPINTGLPMISGTPQVGQTLTASTGTWTNSPTSYAYQWYSNAGGAISGATAATYMPVAGDIGNMLSVAVTATNAGGSSAPATSAPTAAVIDIIPTNTSLPMISGTPSVGHTLIATTGVWTHNPTSYTYQWNRGGTAISGATSSTYVPVTADIGSMLTVTVVAINSGGSSAPATSAPTSSVVNWNLPSFFSVGLRSSADSSKSWMPQSGVPWNFRDQYLNPGWETWNSPSGQFVTNYINDSTPYGYIASFAFYVIGAQNGYPPYLFNNLSSASFMNTYFANFQLALTKAGAFSVPVIMHLEPDMWSFMQQPGPGASNDPTQIPVAVSQYSGLGGLPNNAAGLAQAYVRLRNTYASNVLLAWDNATWAVNFDPTSSTNPVGSGQTVAGFYNKLMAPLDLIFYNSSDRDSGYKVVVLGQSTAQAWWTDSGFSNFRQYLAAIYASTGVKGMLWQTPVGNTLYRSCNNTTFHWQDNRPEYFLLSGNRQHIIDYANAGIVGVIFGRGQDDQTDYYDHAGDGITNPAPITGNNLTANYSDDDGGFMRLNGGAYLSNPVPLP
jgi:hypothetical protein